MYNYYLLSFLLRKSFCFKQSTSVLYSSAVKKLCTVDDITNRTPTLLFIIRQHAMCRLGNDIIELGMQKQCILDGVSLNNQCMSR